MESQPSLIDSIEVNEISASKIAAGTIGAHEIVLGGSTSIIKSSTWDPLTELTGWFISGDGTVSFGGVNGINYTPGVGITIGDDVTIDGDLEVNANNVEINGTSVGEILKISESLDGGNSGLAIGTGFNNYWYTNGNFRVGGASNYAIWNGSSLSVKGNIIADSGTFTGTINASGGSFNGYITAGGSSFGRLDNINGYYHGINVNGGFQSCFIRGNGGEVYFRVDNGSQWLKFENGTVQIKAVGFEVNGSTVTIGNNAIIGNSITIGNSATIGTSAYIGGSLRIGENVRINEATADGGVTTFKVRGGGNASSTWTARFQRENGAYILEARNDLRVGIGSGGTYSLSDERVKQNIKDSDLGLDFIRSLKPRVYNLIDNYHEVLNSSEKIDLEIRPEKVYGFIAQEVKKTADIYINNYGGWDESQETGLQSISYDQLISPIVKAIQELSQKVDGLESRLV